MGIFIYKLPGYILLNFIIRTPFYGNKAHTPHNMKVK